MGFLYALTAADEGALAAALAAFPVEPQIAPITFYDGDVSRSASGVVASSPIAGVAVLAGSADELSPAELWAVLDAGASLYTGMSIPLQGYETRVVDLPDRPIEEDDGPPDEDPAP
jgi:hypothetical protein